MATFKKNLKKLKTYQVSTPVFNSYLRLKIGKIQLKGPSKRTQPKRVFHRIERFPTTGQLPSIGTRIRSKWDQKLETSLFYNNLNIQTGAREGNALRFHVKWDQKDKRLRTTALDRFGETHLPQKPLNFLGERNGY